MISLPEVEASPPEAGTISTTVVVVPFAKAPADPKSAARNGPGEHVGVAAAGRFVNVEQAPRDLPA